MNGTRGAALAAIFFLQLLHGASPAFAEGAPDFCASLKEMVAAGANGFDSVKGEASAKGDRWKVAPGLPGASECVLTRPKDGAKLACTMAWDSDRAVVDPRYAEAKKKVEGCLTGWTATDDASTLDPLATVFTGDDAGVKVAVRLTNAGTAFNVSVSLKAKSK
ncbi:MAG: hypothetical protein HY049_16490 [Acidobacteria bacterium]|nr:hypothetical protein [Acidobacteriota bacterium]